MPKLRRILLNEKPDGEVVPFRESESDPKRFEICEKRFMGCNLPIMPLRMKDSCSLILLADRWRLSAGVNYLFSDTVTITKMYGL